MIISPSMARRPLRCCFASNTDAKVQLVAPFRHLVIDMTKKSSPFIAVTIEVGAATPVFDVKAKAKSSVSGSWAKV